MATRSRRSRSLQQRVTQPKSSGDIPIVPIVIGVGVLVVGGIAAYFWSQQAAATPLPAPTPLPTGQSTPVTPLAPSGTQQPLIIPGETIEYGSNSFGSRSSGSPAQVPVPAPAPAVDLNASMPGDEPGGPQA